MSQVTLPELPPNSPAVDVSEPERSPRAGFKAARIFALASTLAVTPLVTGLPQLSGPAQIPTHPVSSRVHHVGFVTSSVTSMRAARNATNSVASLPGEPDPITTARVTPVQVVAGAVTVVGVTWAKGTHTAADTYQIRTYAGATWGQWQHLDAADGAPDGAEAATATARATGGTDPYIVTGASKYQVRSLTTGARVPTAATVQAVDPGTSGADSVEPASAAAPGAASAATTKPTIYSRAQWGANEGLRKSAPVYGKVLLGFVHHTDSANSYTAAQVPAMIRGIYAYHVQSLGWDDIGYNFLVDRFGRIWEGRYGGMSKAVVGAQTLNYNSVSMGVSAIGNYDIAAVPQAMTNAYKRIFAWKFSLAGIRANGTVPSPRPPSWSSASYFQRISAHRDGFQTTCPGRYLLARLPEIRAGAAALMGAPTAKPVARPVVRPVATPWAVTRYTPYKAVVLKLGSKGTAVVVLQQALKTTADGAFGPKTRALLVAFEKQQKIAQNGIVSKLVWDRIEKRDYPLIAYRKLTVRQGSKGAVVIVVQSALRVKADGAFGPKSAAAVKAVQRLAKLAQTGVVSGWTWVAIENRIPR